MKIDELKKGFFVDDDALKERLESIVAKASAHCKIGKKGQVLIINVGLSSRDQVVLVLVARTIASQLDSTVAADVTVSEIREYTGLPANHARARASDAIEAKFAQSTGRGVYRALPHKLEAFLDGLSVGNKVRKASA
jgi:hypothetical protein